MHLSSHNTNLQFVVMTSSSKFKLTTLWGRISPSVRANLTRFIFGCMKIMGILSPTSPLILTNGTKLVMLMAV